MPSVKSLVLFLLCLLAVAGSSGLHAQEVVPSSAVKAPPMGDGATYRVQGVVTYHVTDRPWYYLQDDAGGMMVIPKTGDFDDRPPIGAEVMVTGVALQGVFAPYLEERDLATRRVLGAKPLPAPLEATVAEVLANKHFARIVRVEGWIMDGTAGADDLRLVVASGDARCVVHVERGMADIDPAQWRGAHVRLTGLNWTVNLGQLRVTGKDGIEILEPAPMGPWPPLTGETWPAPEAGPKPVRLSAVVNYGLPNQSCSVRVDGRSLRVAGCYALSRTRTRTAPFPEIPAQFQQGHLIDATGLLVFNNGSWDLVEAAIAITGTAKADALPKPVAVTARDVLDNRHWWDYITIEGSIIASDTVTKGGVLTDVIKLENSGVLFDVYLQRFGSRAKPALSTDRKLAVTGIVGMEGIRRDPFVVWCPSPADLVKTDLTPQAQAAWWRQALILSMLILAAASGWAFLLRYRMRLQANEQTAITQLNQKLEQRVAERTAELRTAEAELRKALSAERELNQLKTNFVSMVSHEFRTPLGIISVSSELLGRYRDRLKPEQMNEHLGSITNAVKRMTGMMENILVLSRVDRDRLECKPVPLDLPKLLRRLVDEMQSVTDRSHEIELTIESAGVDADARVDEALLRHVLSNLISNACKYSPRDQPVHVTLRRDDGDAVFIIRDHGIGIPEADRERLFESFHRGANVGQISGTGLGLVIVKRCLDLHFGTISIDSEEGQGTTFTVHLPVW